MAISEMDLKHQPREFLRIRSLYSRDWTPLGLPVLLWRPSKMHFVQLTWFWVGKKYIFMLWKPHDDSLDLFQEFVLAPYGSKMESHVFPLICTLGWWGKKVCLLVYLAPEKKACVYLQIIALGGILTYCNLVRDCRSSSLGTCLSPFWEPGSCRDVCGSLPTFIQERMPQWRPFQRGFLDLSVRKSHQLDIVSGVFI